MLLTNSSQILKKANTEQLNQMLLDRHYHWVKVNDPAFYLDIYKKTTQLPQNLQHIEPWVLINQDEKESVNILSHLETITRTGYYLSPTSGFNTIKVRSVSAVYTPEAKRRKGYADAMFRKLMDRMSNENGLVATALFSTVGSYYERFGYKLYAPFKLEIHVQGKAKEKDGEVSYLKKEDIQKLSTWDCDNLKKELSNKELSKIPSTGLFVIEPNFCTYQRFWIVSEAFFENFKLPKFDTYGLKYEDEFIILNYKIEDKEIMILRNSTSKHTIKLFEEIVSFANRIGFVKVSGLNIEPNLFKGSTFENQLSCKENSTSLPYAMFPKLKPEEYPVWENVERYTCI
ncbi:hypothetical protein K502DRAFT_258331 [Neoconidiobolus thromboides FSU 785]|nr:hypothetical protein K502DRAFT_258331 [Neoconidiobolus thromboides FSU 785]